MNDLTLPQKTMSSVEIAEVTEKRHADVMRDIRKMLDELKIGERKFASSYLNKQNKEQPCFELPKRETLILVSGYSIEFRSRIIDRWQELEEHTNPASLSRLQILQLALQAEEEKQQLNQQVEAMKPDVAALERIAKSDGSLPVTDAAKQLQYPPKKLFQWLNQNQWIYRRTGGKYWIAYQHKIQAGYLEHKVDTYLDEHTGFEKTSTRVRVTPKGLAKLAGLLEKALI